MHQAKLTVTNVWELPRAGFTSLFVREIDGCAMNAVLGAVVMCSITFHARFRGTVAYVVFDCVWEPHYHSKVMTRVGTTSVVSKRVQFILAFSQSCMHWVGRQYI